jgi:CDP-paratose 2-epimerase
MAKILITGSSGLVGSEAMSFFKEKGWEVVGVDNNMRSKLFGVAKESLNSEVDIRDEEAVNNIFKEHTFDAILHTAAQPSHDYSKDHVLEDFDINARGTVILLEATRKYCPEAVFVNITTDKVYGENMKGEAPFKEDLGLDFAGCRSPFGCSKTASDIYTQEYGNYFGMKTACFRLGCITGRNHKGAELHGFLAYLTRCIKEGKMYKIFGDGKTVRDQIHAYDLVTACYEFILNPKVAAVYNMGGGPERAVSILEAADLISKELGKPFIHEYHEPRKGDRTWDVHDVSRFRKDYPNWDYKYSLQDIIKDLCSS